MKMLAFLFLAILIPSIQGICQRPQLQSFPLASVRLAESPFKQAQQTDMKYMLALDPDRLLAPFLREAGIEPRAKNYGNWEGTGLDGHIGGHYLSALSNMYAATGNKELFRRLNYMIDWLDSCQKKNGNGYVGGVPGGRLMWQQISNGNIKAGAFSLNEKWVPWYNLHKIYAGLVDAYTIAGNEKARSVLLKLSDWAVQLCANLSDADIQTMLASEHGGMNEVFANVSAITGNKKYLDLARRFSHRAVLDPLLQQRDVLNGMHANTQIPKVIGFMKIAELSAEDTSWWKAGKFFWERVVGHRTVSIGGNSVSEHFNPTNNFTSMVESKEGPETCNSYNMLKLTKLLSLAEPSSRYIDYYERTLYNHILSSQHPEGGFVYFTPMRPRHYRVYSRPEEGFWCCVGSGMENHGKYGEFIYAHDGSDIYVNLFIPSTLNWKQKGITLTQRTAFPYKENTEIKMQLEKPAAFAVNLRSPGWLKGEMKVFVNNKLVQSKKLPSSFIRVQRQWKSGDIITVALPMQTTMEYLPDSSSWVSFVHGPIVLAAVTDSTDLVGLRADGSRMAHVANGPMYPLEEAPVFVSSKKDWINKLTPIKNQPLTFSAAALIHQNKYKNLKLVPFFKVHDARYMIYWPVATPEEFADRQTALREREAARIALEKQTVDQVACGEQQPESDHNFKGENTETGVFNDRHWRRASGWFSYDLKNKNNEARKIRITCFGRERNRHFDIHVNGTLLKTVMLDGSQGNQFFDLDVDLPASLNNQLKENVLNIKFTAQPGSQTANIYYLRLLK